MLTENNEVLVGAPLTVAIADEDMKAACDWAMSFARKRARGSSEVEEVLIDAATDALMWCRTNCTNADTFIGFAKAAVRRWFGRALHRLKLRRSNRPAVVSLEHDVARRRVEQPAKPVLIEDLPEDIAFIVRLYMVDGFSLREIGHLTNQSHDTVARQLHRAAELLAPRRMRPQRANGQKCLSR
ncbi:sigma-70 family RNA polymerase sigma factor [Gemmata sp. G18]|uniref:Sigma-70 family RNA polymerase sigma factor n=1 Tax=Gemmata palustris TaxID=2822762 RepID=A0ABS5C0H0_9BACT|nr:sigma-70 family RNA polymerase sigma factor [Gemmata palustris]MBP3959449.1 sigma-70 family RNA polymerase sigma factor [Gemmata palustris]